MVGSAFRGIERFGGTDPDVGVLMDRTAVQQDVTAGFANRLVGQPHFHRLGSPRFSSSKVTSR